MLPPNVSVFAISIVQYRTPERESKRAGIVLSSHQFRHLSAKVLLDAQPGAFETVRQLLGHKNHQTTVNAYAGIDSRRAARHHQHLVEQAIAPEYAVLRRRRRERDANIESR